MPTDFMKHFPALMVTNGAALTSGHWQLFDGCSWQSGLLIKFSKIKNILLEGPFKKNNRF